jgi:hypothetical protein
MDYLKLILKAKGEIILTSFQLPASSFQLLSKFSPIPTEIRQKPIIFDLLSFPVNFLFNNPNKAFKICPRIFPC